MDKKRTERNLVWVLLLVAGTVWILARHNRPAPYQRDSGLIFGTVYNITYQHESTLKADIEAELRRFDGSLSPFNETLTPYQCLQYALDKPGVVSVLPGLRNREELRVALGYLDSSPEERDSK